MSRVPGADGVVVVAVAGAESKEIVSLVDELGVIEGHPGITSASAQVSRPSDIEIMGGAFRRGREGTHILALTIGRN